MWQICVCVAVVCLLFEIFVPSAFFLSFSLSAFVCSVLSLYIANVSTLVILFCFLSLSFLLFLRPYIVKKDTIQNSGIQEKYIGKTAIAVEKIDKNQGAISIYDERWQARNVDETDIEIGSQVQIITNKSIVMYVKKLDNN